jgi:hypothetical protein
MSDNRARNDKKPSDTDREVTIHDSQGSFVRNETGVPGRTTKGITQAELEAFKLALLEVLDEYRDKWPDLLDGKALRVGRVGQPEAVVIAYADFETILERLEDLEDVRDTRAVLEAIERGEENIITHEQLKAELRAEGLLHG